MKAFARLLALAAWTGLVSGVTELVLRAVEKFGLHRYIYLSRQIVWMTPLADVLVCVAAVALVGGLLPLLTRRPPSFRLSAVVLSAIFALSVLAMQPWLAGWAMAIMTLGVARLAWQVAGEREAAVLKLARRTTPVLLGIILLLTLWVNTRRAGAGRDVAGAAAPAGAPNVLVVVWDAVRAQELSLYGYARPTTPHLDSLAAHAVVFDHAFTTGPYTLPGHAGLFTGRWWHELRAGWVVPLQDSVPTLAGVMAAHGWRTGAFSANHVFVTWEHGLLRGFAHSEDYVFSPGELARSSALVKRVLDIDRLRDVIGWYDVPGRRSAADIRGQFLRWRDADPSRPFFAFLNVFDAHDPYLPPAPFDTLFGFPKDGGRAERRRTRALAISDFYAMSPAQVSRLRDSYDGAIAEADHDFAQLIADLKERGLLDNTLLIVAGDHGEELGEHGAFGHGPDLYLQVTHVPLVIMFPHGSGAGKRVETPVSLRDLSATILAMVNIDRAAAGMPGRDLRPIVEAPAAAVVDDTLLTEVDRMPRNRLPRHSPIRVPLHSMIVWPYQVIAAGPKAELYDLSSDTAQHHDLANDPAHAATRDSLLAALARWRSDAVSAKP